MTGFLQRVFISGTTLDRFLAFFALVYALLILFGTVYNFPILLQNSIQIIGNLTFIFGIILITAKNRFLKIIIITLFMCDLLARLSYGRGVTIVVWMSLLNASFDEIWTFVTQFGLFLIFCLISAGLLWFVPQRFVHKHRARRLLGISLIYAFLPLLAPAADSDSTTVTVNNQYGQALGYTGIWGDMNKALYDIGGRIPMTETPLDLIRTFIYLGEQSTSVDKVWSNVMQVEGSPRLMVLVIGESMRADHLNLYGYPKNTTPMLSQPDYKLEKLTRVYAGGTNTWNSLPYMLSRSSSSNNFSLSVVRLAQAAGYRVHWLSTQPMDIWSLQVSKIINQADDKIFIRSVVGVESFHDGELLPYMNDILSRRLPQDKSLIILHLSGSHTTFSDRYPPAFDIFKTTRGGYERENLIATYDNSILYTDYILDRMIKLTSQYHGELIFFADHGLTSAESRAPLQHDVKLKTSLESLRVPLLYYGQQSPLLPDDAIYSLLYFECIFSKWSGITADELIRDDYCQNGLGRNRIKYYDASMKLQDRAITEQAG